MDQITQQIGQTLIQEGVMTQSTFDELIANLKDSKDSFADALERQKILSRQDYLQRVATIFNKPLYSLKNYHVDSGISQHLNEAYSRQFKAIVVAEDDTGLIVGMANPFDLTAIDELKRVLQHHFQIVLIDERELFKTLDIIYRRTGEISEYAHQLTSEITTAAEQENQESGEVDSTVIKLLKSIFEDAVQVGASDIHIEPDEYTLRIRLRVDGVLQEQQINEKRVANALVVRLKLMANLDIAERRLPQDGRLKINVQNRRVDIRLSTLPTQFGESAVMRLLDKEKSLLDLDKLGMPEDIEQRFHRALSMPNGIILITGPTGSGKTTTLYSALTQLNVPEKKIFTVEDPIEYSLERINQVQVNTKVGLTFAEVLRSTLRQDPDIIMLGEMRDHETADIAIRAALTGHLVLSTLHTNDSASSAFRLVNMDIDGFLVAATLRAVLAQRLLRRVCEYCRAKQSLSDADKMWVSQLRPGLRLNGDQFVQGEGCSHCNNSGYSGRIGIYELLELDQQMMKALSANDSNAFNDHAYKVLEGKLLIDQAFSLALSGHTSLEEVMRVFGE